MNVTMAENGRLVVPAHLRQQLGLPRGGKLVASIQDGVLVLEPFDAAIRRVRDIARTYLKPGESVTDELLAERRKEAVRE